MDRKKTMAIWVHFEEASQTATSPDVKALVLALRAVAELQHAQVDDIVKAVHDLATSLRESPCQSGDRA